MNSEKGALWLSAGAALLVGCVALWVSLTANSQAILLDGMFNLTYFVVALLTLRVSQLIQRPTTDDYPLGYAYFEPLVNGVKGLLILGISSMALFDALGALASGGRSIDVGPAIGYGAFAVTACAATAFLLHRARRTLDSPLVDADAESWTVNAAISGAVLLTFAAIPLVAATGFESLTPYVDPLLVSVIVVISIGVPIRMAWGAVLEVINRAPPPDQRQPVREAVNAALGDMPVKSLSVRMIQPGRSLYVVVYAVLDDDGASLTLPELDAARNRVEADVCGIRPNAVVDVMFTADSRWAPEAQPAPLRDA